MVETLDIFPTACDLAGLPKPEFAHGVSLRPLLESPKAKGHVAVSYHGNGKTIRDDRYRLILGKRGNVELYDHDSAAGETMNIADQDNAKQIVGAMQKQLQQRLAK